MSDLLSTSTALSWFGLFTSEGFGDDEPLMLAPRVDLLIPYWLKHQRVKADDLDEELEACAHKLRNGDWFTRPVALTCAFHDDATAVPTEQWLKPHPEES